MNKSYHKNNKYINKKNNKQTSLLMIKILKRKKRLKGKIKLLICSHKNLKNQRVKSKILN